MHSGLIKYVYSYIYHGTCCQENVLIRRNDKCHVETDTRENDAESKETASSKTYKINQSLSVCTKGRHLGIRINYLKKAGKCLNNISVSDFSNATG